jgi:hypothetical protein
LRGGGAAARDTARGGRRDAEEHLQAAIVLQAHGPANAVRLKYGSLCHAIELEGLAFRYRKLEFDHVPDFEDAVKHSEDLIAAVKPTVRSALLQDLHKPSCPEHPSS